MKTQEGWERMVDMNSLEGRFVAKRKPNLVRIHSSKKDRGGNSSGGGYPMKDLNLPW